MLGERLNENRKIKIQTTKFSFPLADSEKGSNKAGWEREGERGQPKWDSWNFRDQYSHMHNTNSNY